MRNTSAMAAVVLPGANTTSGYPHRRARSRSTSAAGVCPVAGSTEFASCATALVTSISPRCSRANKAERLDSVTLSGPMVFASDQLAPASHQLYVGGFRVKCQIGAMECDDSSSLLEALGVAGWDPNQMQCHRPGSQTHRRG